MMDKALRSEIKTCAGRTKAERLQFLAQCDFCAEELGMKIRHNEGRLALQAIFEEHLKHWPRAVVACCVAATVSLREGMSPRAQGWARDALEAWKPTDSQRFCAYIDDNLNGTRIEEYAGNFIRLTTGF